MANVNDSENESYDDGSQSMALLVGADSDTDGTVNDTEAGSYGGSPMAKNRIII